MRQLNKAHLVAAIDACSYFAPEGAGIANKKIAADLIAQCPPVTDGDPTVIFIRNLIEHYRPIIVPARYEALSAIDIYVSPLPVCNATADSQNKHILPSHLDRLHTAAMLPSSAWQLLTDAR
jgi:hypothetical protein